MAGVALDCPVLASALEPDNGDILGISPPQHGQHHTPVNTINSGSNESPNQLLSKSKVIFYLNLVLSDDFYNHIYFD